MFKSKVYRLLSFLFAFSLVFGLFGVNASAASDNLISSDLTTWTDVSNLQEESVPISVTTGGNVYRVTLSEGDYTIYYGAILDHTSLVSGHSYSLSFKMPSTNEINAAFGRSYSDSSITNHFKNASLIIGVAFISPSGVLNMPDDYLFFDIGSSNYTNFFGKSLSASFVASNYSGTPVVVMVLTSLDGNPHTFYFSDFKLVDNDDNSAELTGIKGFLHSIRWDLVGGVCDEDDCPHSSAGNPHLSLTDRMSTGFQSMFDSIGDSLSSLKESFTEKIGELNTSLSSLGDRMNGFFSNLGDRMSGFFSNLGDRISGFFGSLGDRISGFFSNLKTDLTNWFASVGDWFSTLGDRITTKFQEIGDKFSEFFEKFKPSVTLSLDWRRGAVQYSTGEVTWYSSSEPYPAPYAVVSDFITVPLDSVYYLDYTHIAANDRIVIYQYDLEGNYIKYMGDKNYSFDKLELPSGYNYRLRIAVPYSVTDLNEYISDYVRVYAEEGWINALLLNMKNGIKSLFVPDEQFIATWKEELDTMLLEHLGFLYEIPDFILSYMQNIRDLLKNNDKTYFTFPEIVFNLNGQNIHLWDETEVDFSFLNDEPWSTIYSIYKVALIVLFGAALFKYGKHVWDKKVMSN